MRTAIARHECECHKKQKTDFPAEESVFCFSIVWITNLYLFRLP